MHQLILTFSCHDTSGIVHAVTGAIVGCGGNITELQQFSSTDTGRFFMRIEVDTPVEPEDFRQVVSQVSALFDATWEVSEAHRKARALVLVSKAAGPLNDLLFHLRAGDVPIEIPLILSNHDALRSLAEFYGIDFGSQVVLPENKHEFEDRIRHCVRDLDIDLVVLARYMQILSPELCSDLSGRIINIHHSFLPGFKGANPYRQAHTRGVKLIGATAHFVTSDLDEGPIIEQNVKRVDHAASVSELSSIGQGLESETLTEAVRLFAEKRIFLDGIRTVIFK
ncbi:formyltetrahydrofolate deformylase [Propionimicrobium sp. PCR01-08-3]|uniref:formyltetrahydrofolate deformylase n=1 Tax=Propionimicrobium sp. PCR01-08-3 TaxID=3052086 RepID=UPI00255CD451|nr:formyltetrahydrofolate deformylase [Propionimicrobium sp. PCR01-08-3]WIY83279.1 formyltetrahydrofolate deformylase [Propionimicrobium sp. PCR01-08-3]